MSLQYKIEKPITYNFAAAMEHQSWCFKNDIFIYFQLINWKEGQLVISINGKKEILPKIYKQYKPRPKDPKAHHYAWELYSELYNKHNNKKND